ncbi:hypothetical protein Q1695_010439 [Nippostrongylus brasiliensis]|nr:hypothetical protein Q1695_010439 [Nippostrongylus brasiliensis]
MFSREIFTKRTLPLFSLIIATICYLEISFYINEEGTVARRSFRIDSEEFLRLNAINRSAVLRPYNTFTTRILVLPRYRLAACFIEKNLATIMVTMFCFLHDPMAFMAQGLTSDSGWSTYCIDLNSPIKMFANATKEIDTVFAIVRHPIERFLSGYTHICRSPHLYSNPGRCLDCGSDLRCFTRSMHKLLDSIQTPAGWLYYKNFTIYNPNHPISVLIRHFMPQTWYCDFGGHKNDYVFLKFRDRNMVDDIDELLSRARVPGNLRNVIKSTLLDANSFLLRNFTLNSSKIVPPYRYQSNFFVLPKYHLAVCQIEKNMATILNSVFCFLTNPEGFSAANRTINSNNWAKCRSLKMVAQSFAEARAVTRRSGALFAFIRHPIDRFLSGYVHLCRSPHLYDEPHKCFDCGVDLRCFVTKLHRSLINYYVEKRDNRVTRLPPLVEVILRHLTPQTWNCEFGKHKADFKIINYQSGHKGMMRTAENVDCILKKANVPRHLRAVVKNGIFAGTTPHSTSNSTARKEAERELIADDVAMKHVLEIYFHDFIELGFD